MLVKVLVSWVLISMALIFLYSRRELIATWREPVLHRPVLIIESDDWGAGPEEQADALNKIIRTLSNFTDRDSRRPVMTLGVILATADGKKTLSSGSYHRLRISAHTHGSLLDAIRTGVDAGVFSIQLHGMEHFWPPAVLKAGETDAAVKAWLNRAPYALTEELPGALQSRWVDASVLPARQLNVLAVQQAVREEVDAFGEIFGVAPRIAVPPTFVWDEAVEKAWAAAGISVIVTPGCRYEGRDAQGRPANRGAPITNGQRGKNDIIYLVRDVYFEPSRGHTAKQALDALSAKTKLGRPTLFETHRSNFIGAGEQGKLALSELEKLLQMALNRFPDLAFISSDKLAGIFSERDQQWLEPRLRRRLHVWVTRLGALPRLRRLAWLTGWIVPAGLLWKLTA